MPNALVQLATGQPGSSPAPTQLVTCPLFDPRRERQGRDRYLRDDVPTLFKANALYVPSGKYPARGWVLLRRADLNNLNLFSTNLELQIQDFHAGTPPLSIGPLAVVKTQCVSRGAAADPDAVYLVELTDMRGLVWNHWFQTGTTSAYNVRAPAYPQQYYQDSLQGGATTFTWNGILADLWSQMPVLGTYPNLPIIPTQSAENFIFPGCSAWEALNLILDNLGCAVAADLAGTGLYSLVSLGAADPIFAGKQVAFAPLLQDDLEPVQPGAAQGPGSVVVYFHRRNQYYGTEESVRRDALQWSSTPLYSVTVLAPAPFAGAPGVGHIWTEFTVEFDIDNNPLAADVVTANALAVERADQYYDRIFRGTLGRMHQVYAGCLPFATGSQVDGVCWREDFTRRQGWQTIITRGADPPFPETMPDAR